MKKQLDILNKIFKDFKIEDFSETYNENSVSFQLMSDEPSERAMSNYQWRVATWNAYLRKKYKTLNYYNELQKITDKINTQAMDTIEDYCAIDYSFVPAQIDKEIHILYEIKIYYAI